MPPTGEKQVLRLDVAVDDAASGARTPAPRPCGARGRPSRRRWACWRRKPRREVLAVQPLHRDVALAAVGDAVGDVADDGRVNEARQDRRLLVEPLRLAGLAARQDLDGHRGPGGEIARAVDRAHASRAGLGEEVEAAGDDPLDHADYFGRKTVTLSRYVWPVPAFPASLQRSKSPNSPWKAQVLVAGAARRSSGSRPASRRRRAGRPSARAKGTGSAAGRKRRGCRSRSPRAPCSRGARSRLGAQPEVEPAHRDLALDARRRRRGPARRPRPSAGRSRRTSRGRRPTAARGPAGRRRCSSCRPRS